MNIKRNNPESLFLLKGIDKEGNIQFSGYAYRDINEAKKALNNLEDIKKFGWDYNETVEYILKK